MSYLFHFFMALQIMLLFFMTFHDWVHMPPLTDIRELEKHSSKNGRIINSTIFFCIVFIPLLLTWAYGPELPRWVLLHITIFYGLLTVGTIVSWWIPYLWGSSKAHKEAFAEYHNTHHFLPPRGDNVVPNTLHVILHAQIWACFIISLYLFIF